MPIFISYSHENSDFALDLSAQLVAQNLRVWIDKWELKVGDSIIDRIQNAIEGASALLVILSKASVASEWCKKELNAGLIRELDEKRVVVLPVLIEDCTIPVFLRDKKYADFRKNYDEGLQEVMTAVAAVSSYTMGRIEQATYHTDWSVSWRKVEGAFALEITMADHAKEQPFTVLTEMQIIYDDILTKRHQMFEKAGLGWWHIVVMVCEFSRMANEKKLRLILKNERPQTANIFANDSKLGADTIVTVTSRRLGEDTGRTLYFDVGGQTKYVCESQLKTIRKLTPEEFEKVTEIQATFNKS
jgi:hypothetical protein